MASGGNQSDHFGRIPSSARCSRRSRSGSGAVANHDSPGWGSNASTNTAPTTLGVASAMAGSKAPEPLCPTKVTGPPCAARAKCRPAAAATVA
jgi:hypothetical protein